jgi:predicted transcriptional regulator
VGDVSIGTVNCDTLVNLDTRQNAAMNTIYEIMQHRDGYVVIARGAAVGIATYANILDAIACVRVANRFERSQQK